VAHLLPGSPKAERVREPSGFENDRGLTLAKADQVQPALRTFGRYRNELAGRGEPDGFSSYAQRLVDRTDEEQRDRSGKRNHHAAFERAGQHLPSLSTRGLADRTSVVAAAFTDD
jgi:hypothetical protein